MPECEELGFGITCIDAAYRHPGMVCFYLLQSGDECAVIETGTSHCLATLQKVLAAKGLTAEQLRYIIPTHVHLDHAGGAGAMMAAFPEATLLVHPRGARHMAEPDRLVASSKDVYGEDAFFRLHGEILPVEASRIREMEDGSSVALAGRTLEFRHTRGHANHHFCIWDAVSRGWFSGDMFGVSYAWCRFRGGDYLLPTTTPTQFDPDAYAQSLQLLASYKPENVYLTHCGQITFTTEKLSLLDRQVRDYADLAGKFRDDLPGLVEALFAYSIDMITGFDPAQDEAELRDKLAFDIDLNAQGLALWQLSHQVGPNGIG
jgi:glyoxylase-like metal-dependent hydrolase (beta-lactamase superfamily II)